MQEERIYQEEIIERSLPDLFWSALRHWKTAVVVMLVAAIVLGGYTFYSEFKELRNPEVVSKREENYRTAMENYKTQKENLEKKLKNLQDEQVRLDEYSKSAVMLFVDQYNTFVRTGSYYVDTNYEIAPELFYQNPNYTGVITNSYRAAIDRLDLDKVISEGQADAMSARNPVSGNNLKLVSTSVDAGNGILNYTVYGDTQERVDQIVASIQKVLEDQEVLLNQIIGEHTLGVLSEESFATVNTDFGNLQTSFESKVDSVVKGIETNTKKLEELKEPVNETPSKSKVISATITKTLMGLALGLVATFAYFFLKNVLQDRVLNPDEIRRRYQCPVLGVYGQNAKKQDRINRSLAKKLGLTHADAPKEAIDYIVANIRLYLKDENKLLLVSSCKDENLAALSQLLSEKLEGVEVSVGGNVNDNPAAISALAQEGAIVCVERFDKAAHKDIRHEMHTIRASRNPNVAFIITTA